MGQNKREIRIFVADPSALFRSGLRALFSAEAGYRVVGEASAMDDFSARIGENRPDVLVMDIELPEAEGEHAAFALRHAHCGLPILLLTRTDTPEHLEFAVSAGARGYMLKDSSPAQIVAAVQQLANTREDQNACGLSLIVPDLHALVKANDRYTRAKVLTPRELEVMRLLAEGRTVREAASELCLSIKTVEAHKLNLMRKLDIHNRGTLIEFAMHNGLIPAGVA